MIESDVQAAIRRAFTDTVRPDDDQLIEHDCEECRELQQDFSARTWQAIDRTTIQKHCYDLSLFAAPAFQYFLPAYLLESLEANDSDVWEFTFYSLYQTRDEWRDERWGGFSGDQIEAILSLLRLKLQTAEGVESEDIPIAIRMWERQLSERAER